MVFWYLPAFIKWCSFRFLESSTILGDLVRPSNAWEISTMVVGMGLTAPAASILGIRLGDTVRHLGFVLLVLTGVLAATAIGVVLMPDHPFTDNGPEVYIMAPIGEELLFRGLTQASLEKDIGNSFVAILIVSSIFAIMHLGYVTYLEKTLEIIYVFVAATVLGYAFMKTKSLVLPLIAHGTANTILFGILPYIA